LGFAFHISRLRTITQGARVLPVVLIVSYMKLGEAESFLYSVVIG